MTRRIVFVLLNLLSCAAFAGSPKTNITQWYRFSASSDNQDNHQFKNISGGKENFGVKASTEDMCQFFIFLCGFEPKGKNVDKICDAVWKKYKPHPDVEFGGYNAATEIAYDNNATTLSDLLFRQGLAYASLKSFKVQLAFDKGKLSEKSKIYFRERHGIKSADDDSEYNLLSFEGNEAYFELGARCTRF